MTAIKQKAAQGLAPEAALETTNKPNPTAWQCTAQAECGKRATVSAPTSPDAFGAGLLAELNKWRPEGSDRGKQARRLAGRWRRSLCSAHGPDPTSRFVGLVLSNYMLSNQGNAPTQKELSKQTGLSTKGVGEALHRLVIAHWLVQVSDRRPGCGGHRYLISVPRKVAPARGKTEPGLHFKRSDQTPKPPFRDVETLDSGPKSPQNGIVRDVVIDGGAPC